MPVKQINFSLSNRDGHLYFEDCNAEDLVREFGTPVFVVSENHVRANYRHFRNVLAKAWPEGETRVMPSIKANTSLAVRSVLSEEGAGCDTFGPGELEGALRGGCPPELISMNGSIKSRQLINRAIEAGARIVLDSQRELLLCEEEAAKLNKTVKVMFRIKPYMADLDLETDFAPGYLLRDASQIIKYGIPDHEVLAMGPPAFSMKHVEPVGLHYHIGRHSRDPDMWRALVRAFVGMMVRMRGEWQGWVPQVLNFGGGFPSKPDRDTDVPGADGTPAPDISVFIDALTGTLREQLAAHDFSGHSFTLEIEPGRGMHSETGIHLTTVQNVKELQTPFEWHWAETDTSEVFLGVSSHHGSMPLFDFLVANRLDEPADSVFDIVGMSCNGERLLVEQQVPALQQGDVIALLYTGAYIEPMTTNFNALPRPGIVLVNGNQAEWIKRPETVADVFSRDIIPDRFSRKG